MITDNSQNQLLSAQAVMSNIQTDEEQDQDLQRKIGYEIWKVYDILRSVGSSNSRCKISADLHLDELFSIMSIDEKKDFYKKLINKINNVYKINLFYDNSEITDIHKEIKETINFFETDKIFGKVAEWIPTITEQHSEYNIYKELILKSNDIKNKIKNDYDYLPIGFKEYMITTENRSMIDFLMSIIRKDISSIKYEQYILHGLMPK